MTETPLTQTITTGPLAGFTITRDPADPMVRVLALHAAERLGYLRASDEWVDVDLEPLPDELQDAAHGLVRAGLLPEFADVVS